MEETLCRAIKIRTLPMEAVMVRKMLKADKNSMPAGDELSSIPSNVRHCSSDRVRKLNLVVGTKFTVKVRKTSSLLYFLCRRE